MSDETFGLNCSKEDASELARLLLGSVGRLLKLEQYNDFVKLQAIEDPFKFIADVEKHADTLEKEDESKGFFHIRITGITPDGQRDKISCIKMLRQLMGWGLADSKYSFEALPGSGAAISSASFNIISKPFITQDSLEQSNEWKDFKQGYHRFHYDVIRLPAGTEQSKPYEGNRV